MEANGDRVTWTYDASYQLTREQRSGASAQDITWKDAYMDHAAYAKAEHLRVSQSLYDAVSRIVVVCEGHSPDDGSNLADFTPLGTGSQQPGRERFDTWPYWDGCVYYRLAVIYARCREFRETMDDLVDPGAWTQWNGQWDPNAPPMTLVGLGDVDLEDAVQEWHTSAPYIAALRQRIGWRLYSNSPSVRARAFARQLPVHRADGGGQTAARARQLVQVLATMPEVPLPAARRVGTELAALEALGQRFRAITDDLSRAGKRLKTSRGLLRIHRLALAVEVTMARFCWLALQCQQDLLALPNWLYPTPDAVVARALD